jgi:DtxR family transcriptional regulator, Mn-dependent transcriptional regulator
MTTSTNFIIAGIILLVIFFPRKGLFAYFKNSQMYKEKVLMEDSLKHFLNMQFAEKASSIQSLAGALAVNIDKAAKIIVELEKSDFLSSQGGNLTLSESGRAYALQIVRAHRLWESYLAEETGFSETDWHQKAETLEHDITPERLQILTDKLNNPSHDPHGDPIPTVEGDLGPLLGVPLTSLARGEFVEIIHIEDEPESINKELIEKGLYPGLKLIIEDMNSSEVSVSLDGKLISLSPISATNITVGQLMNGDAVPTSSGIPLSEIGIRQKATVTKITHQIRGAERRRLMDMGLLPGTVIEPEMVSPSGDPTAYIIRGSLIALRKEQADHIFATPIQE